MFKTDYSEAAVEVLDILDNTNENDLNKIPKEFINFLVDIASPDYTVDFDHTQDINSLNLSEKAKDLLGYIYIKWWAGKEEKELYINQIKQKDEEIQKDLSEKYNADNLFKNNSKELNNTNISNENTSIVEYKESIFKRILNKIKNFFGIHHK